MFRLHVLLAWFQIHMVSQKSGVLVRIRSTFEKKEKRIPQHCVTQSYRNIQSNYYDNSCNTILTPRKFNCNFAGTCMKIEQIHTSLSFKSFLSNALKLALVSSAVLANCSCILDNRNKHAVFFHSYNLLFSMQSIYIHSIFTC